MSQINYLDRLKTSVNYARCPDCGAIVKFTETTEGKHITSAAAHKPGCPRKRIKL